MAFMFLIINPVAEVFEISHLSVIKPDISEVHEDYEVLSSCEVGVKNLKEKDDSRCKVSATES